MSDADWPVFRKREPRLTASKVGQRAVYQSGQLSSDVLVLSLDDAQTLARVRHPFGTTWVSLSELRFHA